MLLAEKFNRKPDVDGKLTTQIVEQMSIEGPTFPHDVNISKFITKLKIIANYYFCYNNFYCFNLKSLLQNTVRLIEHENKCTETDIDILTRKIWANYGHITTWLQILSSNSDGNFHYPPYAIESKPISYYFSLFSVYYGMEGGLKCFERRMRLSSIIAGYPTYKFVLLALKLMTFLCCEDTKNQIQMMTTSETGSMFNKFEMHTILSLNEHLLQMIKNNGMAEDKKLAESHALEDQERNRLVDPLQQFHRESIRDIMLN